MVLATCEGQYRQESHIDAHKVRVLMAIMQPNRIVTGGFDWRADRHNWAWLDMSEVKSIVFEGILYYDHRGDLMVGLRASEMKHKSYQPVLHEELFEDTRSELRGCWTGCFTFPVNWRKGNPAGRRKVFERRSVRTKLDSVFPSTANSLPALLP